MTDTIRPIGAIKTYIQPEKSVDVPEGQSVRQALQAIGIPVELVALVLVNDDAQSKDYILHDGDEVKIMAVIGGGSL